MSRHTVIITVMNLDDLTAGARTLFAHTPGVIDLGIGAPDATLLEMVRAAMEETAPAHLADPRHALFCQYGPKAGDPVFRNAISDLLGRRLSGRAPRVEQLFITAGATSGLSLIATTFFPQGAPVLIEDPTYFLARKVLAQANMTRVSVHQDAHGLSVEHLARIAEQLPPPTNGRRFRAMLYLVPTFNNPTGVTLSQVRRQHIVALAKKHDLLVVCDDVYDMLSFSEKPPPRLVCLEGADGHVFSNSSFSKILGPGMRCGWIEGSADLIDGLQTNFLVRSGGAMSHFTAGILLALLESGRQDQLIDHLRSTYRMRCDALCRALQAHLPEGASFTPPQGGYFVWVTLPPHADTLKMLPVCQQDAMVRYQPGRWFGTTPNSLRLSFAHNHTPLLQQGAQRLGSFWSKHTSSSL